MNLQEFFEKYPKCAIGFSGGVDSSYLLYVGKKYGADIKPYYVKTAFQPEFETNDAKRICDELGISLTIINLDVLAFDAVTDNPKDRCYHCKNNIFGNLKARAIEDGYNVIVDGTNFSDDVNDRPGMKAINEMQVLSPLRICELTKTKIRRLSKEAGLFTHQKPAYACLATRIPTGTKITGEILAKVEQAEEYLFSKGFTDFRVRVFNGSARLQFKENQIQNLLENRAEIYAKLKEFFDVVVLDLEVR